MQPCAESSDLKDPYEWLLREAEQFVYRQAEGKQEHSQRYHFVSEAVTLRGQPQGRRIRDEWKKWL